MTTPDAVLVLDDGSFYIGNFLGLKSEIQGELCFNTSMTGYQEVISDPSYFGQIVVFTFPYIGNTGVNSEDNESGKIHLRGIVIANDITAPSNQRSEEHLEIWLRKHNVTGICNINTRSLVKKIRNAGRPVKCIISPFDERNSEIVIQKLYSKIHDIEGLSGHDYSINVQSPLITLLKKPLDTNKRKLIIIDYGVKKSILNVIQNDEFETIVLPGNSTLDQILEFAPVGILLSNGPGDPRSTIVDNYQKINRIIDLEIPLLGICLGYQLIGLALGGKIAQLSCGHHGTNHPVYDLESKKTFISSQNHEFHLLIDSLPVCIIPTYLSLFDKTLEGFLVKNKPIMAIQFHPEGNPGPNDCIFIFKKFLKMAKEYAQKK